MPSRVRDNSSPRAGRAMAAAEEEVEVVAAAEEEGEADRGVHV